MQLIEIVLCKCMQELDNESDSYEDKYTNRKVL